MSFVGGEIVIIIIKRKLKKKFSTVALLLVTLIAIVAMSISSKDVFLSNKRKLPIYSVDTKEKR